MNRLALPLLAALFLLAPPSAAQTYHAFGTSLSGANEVPPNGSTAVGIVGVVYVDNPSPAPDLIVVRGGFEGLTGNYLASHLHEAPAGQNGPIVQGLTAVLEPDNRSGEWTDENTYLAPAGILAKLQAGLIYANVHSTAFPDGEIRGQLAPVPFPDGDLSDPLYQTLATKRNNNQGFGPDIDVTEIVYYADLQNELLFLGLKGELNTASSDGIGLWLDFSELAGVPAGNALGGVPNAGHFMGAAGNPNYTADFEVDYAFAVNPGGTSTTVYFDAVKYVGTVQADYLGETDQSGTVAIGPPDDTDNNGNPAFFRAVAFAFDNSGGADTGLEFAIPFSELGITGEDFAASSMSAFAFVVSSTAYFSDVTVPGDVTAGNLGFDPDFDANLTSANCQCPNPSAPIGTGPYHATVSLGGCEQELAATLDDNTPAPGQVITFTVTVTNHASSPAPLDLWLDATGPVNRRIRLASGTLPAGVTVTRNVRLRVPGAAPSGTYDVDLHIGDFAGNDVCDTVEFTITVSAPAVGGGAEFEVLDDFFAAEAAAGSVAPVVASPNPFVSQTRLSFTLAQRADVRLAVYDVRGREVVVLVDGPREAGSHAAVFDASGLPSGVYLYRLTAGATVETGRLTVLR